MQELVGASKIAFGTDLPFAEKAAPLDAKDLQKYRDFFKDDHESIGYKNCYRLLPQFRINGEIDV